MPLCVCVCVIKRLSIPFHSFSPSFLCYSFFPIHCTTHCFWTSRESKVIFSLENGDIFNTTVVPRGYIHYCKRRWGSILARVSFWTWAGIISLWCFVWLTTLSDISLCCVVMLLFWVMPQGVILHLKMASLIVHVMISFQNMFFSLPPEIVLWLLHYRTSLYHCTQKTWHWFPLTSECDRKVPNNVIYLKTK